VLSRIVNRYEREIVGRSIEKLQKDYETLIEFLVARAKRRREAQANTDVDVKKFLLMVSMINLPKNMKKRVNPPIPLILISLEHKTKIFEQRAHGCTNRF
jgi:hypothetical protein